MAGRGDNQVARALLDRREAEIPEVEQMVSSHNNPEIRVALRIATRFRNRSLRTQTRSHVSPFSTPD